MNTREMFEAWYAEAHGVLPQSFAEVFGRFTEFGGRRCYNYYDTQRAWEAWQAASGTANRLTVALDDPVTQELILLRATCAQQARRIEDLQEKAAKWDKELSSIESAKAAVEWRKKNTGRKWPSLDAAEIGKPVIPVE